MEEIQVERPERAKLEEMGVFSWPIWESEPKTFDWSYGEPEVCYLLEGRAHVEPKGEAKPVDIAAGDLVRFPQGMDCTWAVTEAVRKHYRLG